jgi:glycosyltransferase involved in cell wall biosynthesis
MDTNVESALSIETHGNNGAAHSVSCTPSDRRIKILFMIDHVHGFGGTERHLYHLVQHLDKEKFSCYLMVLDGVPSVLRLYENKGCHVLPYSLNRIYDWRAMQVAWKLIAFLKQQRIDIVQTFHFGSDTFGAIVARLAGVPLLISGRRDLGSYRTGYVKLIDRMIYPLFHRYLSVCRAVSETLIADGISRQKISEIPNGVDLSNWPVPDDNAKAAARKRLNIARDAFVIGNLSHFRPEKGHIAFFEAIRRVAPQISKLHVFALGAGKQRMEQEIEQDPVLRKIVTVDKVADVRDYLPAFDIACLTPTMNEGFSNALIEEMAAGLPVIATDVGGNREAVVDGVTGYIVPPGDDPTIAAKIMGLYQNPELRRTMGAKARVRVEVEFSLERMVAAFETQYQNLHAQHRRYRSTPQLRLDPAN